MPKKGTSKKKQARDASRSAPAAQSTTPQPLDVDELNNPPIAFRRLDVLVDLRPEHFEQRIPKWLARVSSEFNYPRQRIRKHWFFSIEKGDPPRPVGRLFEIPLIERLANNDKLHAAIEVVPQILTEPSRIRFTLGRPYRQVTRYHELRSAVFELLPSFLKAVQVDHLGGICLSYRNDLSASRYPQFTRKDNFEIGRVLNFFRNNLVPAGSCVPPFRAELNRKIGDDDDKILRMRVEEREDQKELAIVLILEYNSLKGEKPRSVEDFLSELDAAHSLILADFEQNFTEEAITLFRK